MTAGELMTTGRLVTAPPETPILDARRRMLERCLWIRLCSGQSRRNEGADSRPKGLEWI